jgi:hypothetical protein
MRLRGRHEMGTWNCNCKGKWLSVASLTGHGRSLVAGLALAGGLLAAGRAQAETVFMEAEGLPISDRTVRITSPFQIKDDAAASSGRYLTVAAGNNSQTSPPATEGVATYHFNVANAIHVPVPPTAEDPFPPDMIIPTSGVYRIWARVIAPTTTDDSFWFRMDTAGTPGSQLIKWNDIDPGTTWHWALLKADGATAPAQFTLASGDHDLQVSYREDGAKLDLIVITDDPLFNPKSPPKNPPPQVGDVTTAIALPVVSTAGSKAGIKVMWSEVPGAKSYTVRRVGTDDMGNTTRTVLKSGLTTHALTDLVLRTDGGSNCYDVLAVFPDGSPREPGQFFAACQSPDVRFTFMDDESLSATPPMTNVDNALTTLAGTPNSLTAAPAHGRLRLDFQVGAAAKVQLWFMTEIASNMRDSFWARMDNGAWIKWNNIAAFCDVVSNSDAGGARVTFSLAAGSHTFELANRETGTRLSNVFFITDDLKTDANTLCND